MWDLNLQVHLTTHTKDTFDLDGILGKGYNEYYSRFGDETGSEEDGATGYTYYQHGAISILVDPESNRIESISMDYRETQNKSQYTFSGIDGNSSIEDVISAFGQSKDNSVDQIGGIADTGFIGYGLNDSYLKFEIDRDMRVVGFTYFYDIL